VISVVIADDQALLRDGFKLILDAQEDLSVVGEAADGASAVEECRRLQPDVVLMDIRMPGMDGIEATRRIVTGASVRTRVLILTTFDLDQYVYEAMKAGASGFLLKTAPAAELAAAVRVAARGETLLAPEVTKRLLDRFVSAPPPGAPVGLDELTEREVEVLALIGRGLSNAEIAAELVVGEATVKTHVNRIFGKLGVRDRAQAVVRAYESGLVRSG
jgi:DNA-binding NarL/FixJ family response regulator